MGRSKCFLPCQLMSKKPKVAYSNRKWNWGPRGQMREDPGQGRSKGWRTLGWNPGTWSSCLGISHCNPRGLREGGSVLLAREPVLDVIKWAQMFEELLITGWFLLSNTMCIFWDPGSGGPGFGCPQVYPEEDSKTTRFPYEGRDGLPHLSFCVN